MKTTAASRALFACYSLAVLFTLYSARLIFLQVTKHDDYVKEAADKHTDKQVIHARRGAILDVNGEPLAQNEPVRTVVADASMMKDPDAVARLLAGPLQMTVDAVGAKLARRAWSKALNKMEPARYIVIKKDVPEAVAVEIETAMRDSNLRGVHYEHDSTRVYPNAHLLSHVLGYVNGECRGVEGVERNFDGYLRGEDGFRYIERDGSGRELVQFRGQEIAAQNGANVRLTIDMGLQNIVESELEAACKLYKPKSATVILMDPKTGGILAMANRPTYDPNQQEGVEVDHRRNRAITDQMEPGSTFKIVTTAAALDMRLVNPNTQIFCENGFLAWAKLHDHAIYGNLSVNDVLVHSSNIGVAKLGIQMGDQKLYEYIRKFGFGERTGVNLPGESGGIIHPPHAWSKVSITRMPMGHEVTATPLQIVTAMSAIANGGRLMMPQIASEITDAQGHTIATYAPQEVRRVVSQQAVAAVRSALLEVVSPKGTASSARVFGYKVAGKTGTAQKLDEDGHYSHEKYVVSFVGYMPAEDPAFAAIIMFDEAKTKQGQNYGGVVAGPIFSRIGEKAARYLALKPTEERPQGEAGTAYAGGANFRDQ